MSSSPSLGPFKSPSMGNLSSPRRKPTPGPISLILETKSTLSSTLRRDRISRMKRVPLSRRRIHLLESSNDCSLLRWILRRRKTTDLKTTNLFWIIMTKDQHFTNPNLIIKTLLSLIISKTIIIKTTNTPFTIPTGLQKNSLPIIKPIMIRKISLLKWALFGNLKIIKTNS